MRSRDLQYLLLLIRLLIWILPRVSAEQDKGAKMIKILRGTAVLFLFFCLSFYATVVLAVDYNDGTHCNQGWYGIVYGSWFSSNEITDGSGDTEVGDLDLDAGSIALRPVYYGREWVVSLIIPFGYIESDHYAQNSGGLGDIYLGAGYFLPVDCINILPFVSVKLPSGDHESDRNINIGSGQTDVSMEIYINKHYERFSFDGVFKYRWRFDNGTRDLDPGDEYTIEGLITYELFPGLRAGPGLEYLSGGEDILDGEAVNDSSAKLLILGAEVIWQATPDLQIMVEGMSDLVGENVAKGTLFRTRICYSF
ncbi:MAG: hypothetical protein GF392_06010 [Candidatus Omnitrophica bacterium]|nr:hypothetical protein [Candidatus Omnitrophota bacterium]